MNDTTSPFFVALLFILRCIVPLVVLFGISYLLRKLGLVAVEAPEEPEEQKEIDEKGGDKTGAPASQEQTGPAQPKSSETPTDEKHPVETPRSRSK